MLQLQSLAQVSAEIHQFKLVIAQWSARGERPTSRVCRRST